MTWLSDHLAACRLEEAHEGYVLGRGGQEESIHRMHLVTWSMLAEAAPDEDFRERYGALGQRLIDWLVWPLWSPRGRVIGFAGRRIDEKTITRYLLPEAAWNPIWTGLTPESMQRIWDGGNVWVVEGLFDLLPLEWVVPSRDVVLGSERAQLTGKHVEFLRRFCTGIVRVVYDNDETGRRGTFGWQDEETGKPRWGALQRLERVGLRAVAVPYRGKDPGEVWRHGGANAIRAAFGAASL